MAKMDPGILSFLIRQSKEPGQPFEDAIKKLQAGQKAARWPCLGTLRRG